MATKTRKAVTAKATRSSKKRASLRKPGLRATGRATSSKRRATPRTVKQTPVARVKRVTRQVVQQASVAMTAGMETLKGLGGNLVERVRA